MSAELIRRFAQGNDDYVQNDFEVPSRFSEFPNQKAVLILTCMDPRSDVSKFWRLPFGPGILRNAGGRATADTLRSMRVLSTIMANGQNTLGVVAVIHHTDCGLMNFGNEYISGKLKERVKPDDSTDDNDVRAAWKRTRQTRLAREIDHMDHGSFKDVKASVREDMAIIKDDPLLPKDLEVIGFVHDSFTGKTVEVAAL